jgi:biopolymer transport protein ExbD
VNFLGGIQQSKRSRAVVRIAGLVDLVFLLLAFFLVTTALLEPESRVVTSLGARGGSATDVGPVEILVQLDGWQVGGRAITSQDDLQVVLEALPRGPGIVIKAGHGVSAGAVIATIRVARQAGITTQTLETSP